MNNMRKAMNGLMTGGLALVLGYAGSGLDTPSYAQDAPEDDRIAQSEGRLESRLVDVDSKLRYDVFDRIYDGETIAKYAKVSDEALAREYGDGYVAEVGRVKKARGFAIGYGEALEDAFDNPEAVISAMDDSDRELYGEFDATETLKKQGKDSNFREMLGVADSYEFSADRESDKLAAFVAKYVADDMDAYVTTSLGVAKVVLAAGDPSLLKDVRASKVDPESERFSRATKTLRRIFK